jgi:hypothetical protein
MARSPFGGEAPMARKAARKPAHKSAPRRKPRSPLLFKRRDMARAMRSAKDAELPLDRIEVDPVTGRFSMIFSKPGDEAAGECNEWDEEFGQQRGGHAPRG